MDRVAVIVDDQSSWNRINSGLENMILRYDEQNIPKPPMDNLKDKLLSHIIEELQLQLANRAGVRISDTELNDSIIRIAANNQMELQQFIDYVEQGGESMKTARKCKKTNDYQRIQRGRVGSEISITERIPSFFN